MTEPNQTRITEWAREREVKAKAIIDYLPEAGVTEKKTHSSSIDIDAAERVRKHFRDAAEEEAAAEQRSVAEKTAKEAAPPAPRVGPAPGAPPPIPPCSCHSSLSCCGRACRSGGAPSASSRRAKTC